MSEVVDRKQSRGKGRRLDSTERSRNEMHGPPYDLALDFLAACSVDCWSVTTSAIHSILHTLRLFLVILHSAGVQEHGLSFRYTTHTSQSLHNAESICIAGADFGPQPEHQAPVNEPKPPAAEVHTQSRPKQYILAIQGSHVINKSSGPQVRRRSASIASPRCRHTRTGCINHTGPQGSQCLD